MRMLGGAAMLTGVAVGTGLFLTGESDEANSFKETIKEQTVGKLIPNLPTSARSSVAASKIEAQSEAYIPSADADFSGADYIGPGVILAISTGGIVVYLRHRKQPAEQSVALGRMYAPVPDYLCDLSVDEQIVIDELELQFKSNE